MLASICLTACSNSLHCVHVARTHNGRCRQHIVLYLYWYISRLRLACTSVID